MTGVVKTLLYGVADPRQAAEVARLGVDGIVVALGDGGGTALTAEAAAGIARSLPPLTARAALVCRGRALPDGFHGAVFEPKDAPPPEAQYLIARVEQEHLDPDAIPSSVDAVWVRPTEAGSSAATRFDYRALERLSGLHRLILEIPDGAAGVETAIRLARPYGLLFGDAVWVHPGIIDFDALESALATVARLNKSLLTPD